MALLFLLKKKFDGGISSREIGVRSLAKITLGPEVSKLDCKGVSVVIGLPISMNFFPSIVCEVSVGVTSDKGGTIFLCLVVSQIAPLFAALDTLSMRLLIIV
jgi:hypothetical protein